MMDLPLGDRPMRGPPEGAEPMSVGGPLAIPPGAVLVPVPGAGPMGPFVPMMPGPNGPVPIAGAMPMGGGSIVPKPAPPPPRPDGGKEEAADMDGADWEVRSTSLTISLFAMCILTSKRKEAPPYAVVANGYCCVVCVRNGKGGSAVGLATMGGEGA